jgi:hypothetical protein
VRASTEYLDLGDAALGTYRHLALDELAARGERPAVQLLPLDPAMAAALGLNGRWSP